MTQKYVRDGALLLIFIFAIMVITYPLIFGTNPHPKNEPPVELELRK